MRAIVPLACAAVVAVAYAAANIPRIPTKIELTSDTLIVNGKWPLPVPVRALDESGKAIRRPGLTYHSSSPFVQVNDTGGVTCAKSADAVVTASRGTLNARVTVVCRPIMSFSAASWGIGERLYVGGPPMPPHFAAIGRDYKRIDFLRGSGKIGDTTVAKLVGGLIYPLRIGKTRLYMNFGGVKTSASVAVVGRAIQDSILLVGGEIRTWRVAPGYYEIFLGERKSKDGQPALLLAANRANCAPSPEGDEHHIYCITEPTGVIVVVNPRRPGVHSELAANLQVLRLPDPTPTALPAPNK